MHLGSQRRDSIAVRLIAMLCWIGLAGAAIAPVLSGQTPDKLGAGYPVALLTLLVGAVVATFALRYLRADRAALRFHLSVAALILAVLVTLMTDTLLAFAAAWTTTGLLLAGLVGHDRTWPEARSAAGRLLKTFVIGDLALHASLILLWWDTGATTISAALAAAPALSMPLATTLALLLVVAAAARCALPPFGGWLLSSLTAPTPVSALMHAGVVNAGGVLLIRFAPLLESAPPARWLAIGLGLAGAVYGLGVMMVRPDVKRALAGSTISQMGFMVMTCGLGAYAAALWHVIAHGLFKAWLFLGSGSEIGMKLRSSSSPLSATASLWIAAATLGLGLSLVAFAEHNAALLPLLLAAATALAMICAGLRAPLSGRARLVQLCALLLLFAVQAVGLSVISKLIGPDAPAAIPAWLSCALAGGFLLLWLWQQTRLAAERAMPLRLYVHFLNAGALPAPRSGDAA